MEGPKLIFAWMCQDHGVESNAALRRAGLMLEALTTGSCCFAGPDALAKPEGGPSRFALQDGTITNRRHTIRLVRCIRVQSATAVDDGSVTSQAAQ